MSSTPREWAALALVLLAAAWLQHDVLRAHFFADDFLFLDQVRGRGLIETLLSRDPLGNFMRPVSRQLHFWWLSRVGHETQWPFYAANLTLFLASIALLQRIARRFAGPIGATVACTILALHYAADVPLRWASGSQDLLALSLALTAILLQLKERRIWAAIAYGLAMLSKETVVLTPVVAWALEAGLGRAAAPATRGRVAAPQPGFTARLARITPMLIAGAAWGVLWLATRSSRPGAAPSLHPEVSFVPAAFVHFLQALAGLEWGARGLTVGWSWPAVIPTLLAVAGATLAMRDAKGAGSSGRPPRFRAALASGTVWALCGLAPVVAVAAIWSAYYYLFALCGAALVIGASIDRLPRAIPIALIALFATLSTRAAAREEFATAAGAWTTQSHVTRFYIERSTRAVSALLDQLKQLHPTLPPRSTLFFGGVPPHLGWQTADGPLFRWAYRDPTVRSYFISDFTREKAERGPNYFFDMPSGQIKQLWAGRSPLRDITYTMLIEDRLSPAQDVLSLWVEDPQAVDLDRYLLAWLDFAVGKQDSARVELKRIGVQLEPGRAPEVQGAYRMLAAHGDTMRVISDLLKAVQKHPFDAGAHALLADALLMREADSPPARIEAFAARVLAPEDPTVWRRWAQVQLLANRHRQAATSLDRYFQLGGDQAANDVEAHEWRNKLRLILPGGALAQEGLRLDVAAPAASGP